jgi:two-component system cell cycle sensor histidine kinase PleC
MQWFNLRRLLSSPARRDMIAVTVWVIISFTITAWFDLSESLAFWRHEHPRLDLFDLEDLPFAFMYIALGAAWFAVRRWREHRRESLSHGATLARLTLAMDEVVAANQAKSLFLANMSHELRTPLNAVLGFADIIRNQSFGPGAAAKYRSYAHDIHSAGQHLLSVVSDILDFARSEAGVLRFVPSALDLGHLLEEVRRLVAATALEGGLVLEVVCAPGLIAWADVDKLRQAVLNIAANAIKFTPRGGRVSLAAEPDGDAVAIRIRDTGIGIAPADIPRAFTPFQQIDSGPYRRFGGTGLGLPLAKRYVEQQGGSFTLESKPGAGTVVTIRIPLAPSVAAAA